MSTEKHPETLLQGCKALILAGGSGTRLWPYSRSLYPKQLLALTGERTLLQDTVHRAMRGFAPEDIWVITNEEQVFEVRSQLRELNETLDTQVLTEPMRRNTLPAIMLGMEKASQDNPDALVAVFPSDHMIHKPELWLDALKRGTELARDGWFVTFGLVPDKPETGYGYIREGESLGQDCYKVGAFVEKPDYETALKYLESGEYLWNSGMFIFSVPAFIQAVEKYQPELYAWWKRRRTVPLAEGYTTIPDISVDYGIMEKVKSQATVRADFGWDDLGSWEALHRMGVKDESGNVIQGDVLNLDCEDSLLLSRGGKLAAVEVNGLVVVQTRDATLVCPANKVQRVKDVVEKLKEEGSSLAEAHVTVHRPWGSYTVLEEKEFYKLKRITVKPGAKLSLQRHHHRSEHWVVIRGTAEVTVNDDVRLLYEDQSVDIPKTATHRLANPGKVPVEIIEIQSGPYLEEDDIVRFDDVYGRIKGD